MLNKDLKKILHSKGSDSFKKGDIEFCGHFKRDAQVIFDDNSIGYKTTLLITQEEAKKANLKLRDTIFHLASDEAFKITQILKEGKVLNRLVLEGVV